MHFSETFMTNIAGKSSVSVNEALESLFIMNKTPAITKSQSATKCYNPMLYYVLHRLIEAI